MSHHPVLRSHSSQSEDKESSLIHSHSAGPHITRRPHYSSDSSDSAAFGWSPNNFATLPNSSSGRLNSEHKNVLPLSSSPRHAPTGVSTIPRNGTLSRPQYHSTKMPNSQYRTLPQSSYTNAPTRNVAGKGSGSASGYQTLRMNSSPLPSSAMREDYRLDSVYSPVSTIAASKGTIEKVSLQMPCVKGYVPCVVTLLDGTDHTLQIKRSAKGLDLFDQICTHLDIKEREYFALAYVNSEKIWSWLRLDKKINNYLDKAPWFFDFRVRFYPHEPKELHDDLTRYLLCLQVRQDIYSKKLPVSYFALVVLNAYVVQSEVGNHDASMHSTGEYVWEMLLLPPVLHTAELSLSVVELHKQLRGLLPEQADLQFLEIVKKLSLYGIEFHSVKDMNNIDMNIGFNHMGILVYRNRLRINRFFWPKIVKVSYLRCLFRIYLRPSGNDKHMRLVEFRCENTKRTRRLWKACVAFHTFFRLRNPLSSGKKSVLPSGLLSRQFRRSLTTLTPASGRPWPTLDGDGDDESNTLRNRNSSLNRRQANRKSWHAKESHAQPVNIGTRPGQLNGLEAWDYVDATSPTNSIRGETLSRPRLVTSQALRHPPPGGSRILRPTARAVHSESGILTPPAAGSTPSILDEHPPKPPNERKYPRSATIPSKMSVEEAPYASIKGYNRPPLPGPRWYLSHVDATPVLMVDRQDGLTVRDDGLSVAPQGCRSNWGVSQYGKYYYEMRVSQHQHDQRSSPPCVRVGWSTLSASLVVGDDKGSFSYGASRLHKPKSALADQYSFRITEGEGHSDGEVLSYGDVIGCYLDLNVGRISWTRNGIRLSSGFTIPPALLKEGFFPACTLRNCTLEAHFDEKSLLYRPGEEWLPLPRAPLNVLVANKRHGWRLNPADATTGMDLAADGFIGQAKWNRGWQGARTNFGIAPHNGRYYFEVTPIEMDTQKESGVLLGWSVGISSLRLGEDVDNVGYGGTLHSTYSKGQNLSSFGVTLVNDSGFQKSFTKEATAGKSQVIHFKQGDVIGCCLDYNRWTISWYVNGELVLTNVTIQARVRHEPLYPTITVKNATVECNFGDQPFRYHRQDHGSSPVCAVPPDYIRSHPSIQSDEKKLSESKSVPSASSSWREATVRPLVPNSDTSKALLNSGGTTVWSSPKPSSSGISSNYVYTARALSSASSTADNKSQPSYQHESGISVGDTSLSEESHTLQAPITKEYTTVMEGEPIVEKESFIAEDGTRMIRTVKRTRIVTKTASATMYPPSGVEQLSIRPLATSSFTTATVPPTTTTINTVKTIHINASNAVTTGSSTSLTYSASLATQPIQSSCTTSSQYLHPHYQTTHQSYIHRSPSPHHRQASPQPSQMGVCGATGSLETPPVKVVGSYYQSPQPLSRSQSPRVGHTHYIPSHHDVTPSSTNVIDHGQGHLPHVSHQQPHHQHHNHHPVSHEDKSAMCGTACGACGTPAPGVACSHGIPTMVTKTSYYCYHPSPNETKEEAMAKLAQAIKLAESSSSQGNEATTEINLLGSLPATGVTAGSSIHAVSPRFSASENEAGRLRILSTK